MSITHIETVIPTPQTTATVSPLTAVMSSMTAGDLIAATISTFNAATIAGDVTDTQGNTYTRVTSQEAAASATHVAEFWAIAQAGANTVSLQCNGGAGSYFRTGCVSVYRSTTGWPANPVNASNQASSTGADPTSPAITTTVADTVVRISVTDDVSTGAYTPPGGSWINRLNDNGTSDHNALVVDDRIVTTTQAGLTATWLHASANFGKIGIAYQAVAGGGGTTVSVFIHHLQEQGIA